MIKNKFHQNKEVPQNFVGVPGKNKRNRREEHYDQN